MKKFFFIIGITIIVAGVGFYIFTTISLSIIKVTLESPDNSALKENIHILLNKPAQVQIEYWEKGSNEKNLTPFSQNNVNHSISLLLLKPNSYYDYIINIRNIFKTSSRSYTFKTRKQSSWLEHNWIKKNKPHDASAIGKGLMMICYRGNPGYIAMVDGEGTIRWYWQENTNLGVRLATITPRNTIIALLAPASKDQFPKKKDKPLGIENYYIRTGKTGFVGGTEIAEIDLEGKVLWRVNIEDKDIIFHHDLKMNENNEIVSIYRDYKLYDLENTKAELDTIWGDGIMKMDTTGKIIQKWSVWDVWDIEKDKRLKEFANDRFHFNNVAFDTDGNYILSTPIENQIWKIDKNTGEIVWKLGKGGDFKMDSNSNFYFQHNAHIDLEGNLLLFDNGDFTPNDTTKTNKLSRTLSFRLDTDKMTATTIINTEIPPAYYTSRMGSSYLLPNKNILQTSSKTGNIFISDKNGEILWLLKTSFIPYRAEYVSDNVWQNYIQ